MNPPRIVNRAQTSLNLALYVHGIMRPRFVGLLLLPAILGISLPLTSARAADLVVDRAITLHSARDIPSRRAALIQYLLGPAGVSQHPMTDTVNFNVSRPGKGLTHLQHVDGLT